MIREITIKVLVYMINILKIERKIYSLSNKAFLSSLSIKTTADKYILQERIIKLKKIILNNLVPVENLKRYGAKNDGGYVLYSGFSPLTTVISCGIGDNASFDFDVADEVSEVYMYDHTIDSVEKLKTNMQFFKLGIDIKSIENFITIKEITNKYRLHNIILKLDIEGMEWDILDNLSDELLLIFDQVAVEFHNLFQLAQIEKFNLYIRVLEKMSKYFSVINIHPNNWGGSRIVCGVPLADTFEITFLSKQVQSIPLKSKIDLNNPNNPNEPELRYIF